MNLNKENGATSIQKHRDLHPKACGSHKLLQKIDEQALRRVADRCHIFFSLDLIRKEIL